MEIYFLIIWEQPTSTYWKICKFFISVHGSSLETSRSVLAAERRARQDRPREYDDVYMSFLRMIIALFIFKAQTTFNDVFSYKHFLFFNSQNLTMNKTAGFLPRKFRYRLWRLHLLRRRSSALLIDLYRLCTRLPVVNLPIAKFSVLTTAVCRYRSLLILILRVVDTPVPFDDTHGYTKILIEILIDPVQWLHCHYFLIDWSSTEDFSHRVLFIYEWGPKRCGLNAKLRGEGSIFLQGHVLCADFNKMWWLKVGPKNICGLTSTKFWSA